MDGVITNSRFEEENLSVDSRNQLEISLLKSTFSPTYFNAYGSNLDLTPSSIENLCKFKYFFVENKALPWDLESLVDLEDVQVKLSIWLWNLEICRGPRRLSALLISGEIRNLKWLKMLSICHLSIRCLPPEIGSLKKLEDLDLSFNKLKNLPKDIGELNALKSLRVASNKLVDLPPEISSLRSLERLDLSSNRLTLSVQLKLASMLSLQCLNLQYNAKLHGSPQIPSHQGPPSVELELRDGEVTYMEDIRDSLVDVKVPYASVHRGAHGHCSFYDCRCSLNQRTKKGNRQHDSMQQRARQERLNYSRQWRLKGQCENMKVKMDEEHVSSKSTLLGERQFKIQLDDNEENITDCCSVGDTLGPPDCVDNGISELRNITIDDSSCLTEFTSIEKGSSSETESVSSVLVVDFSSIKVEHKLKSKRHCDRDLENPKPSKFRRPVNDSSMSWKYNMESFCSIDDHLPDGFFDAGRERPFMSLEEYEKNLCLDSREVILLDRNRDEELDVIASSAQRLLSCYRRTCSKENKDFDADNLKRASILALFISDCFGGSDRSFSVMKLRRGILGSKKQQPFICTCLSFNELERAKQAFGVEANFNFTELCESYLRLIKVAHNSIVVPIGTLRFGVCRHRAVLMKYLCDRADPPIPCELVRGYLDFMPHAWNAIHIKKGTSLVRMVVDTCCPTDIREETDPEYYSRYVPLCRVHLPLTTENSFFSGSPLSSLILPHETECLQAPHVFRCQFGTLDAVAKVRNLESCQVSQEELRTFEYSFIGEVRMLGALRKHSCIVEIFAHQLSTKWAPSVGGKENKLLQSVIVMEYIKGGSVKKYLENLSKRGEKHAPVEISLCIARDVACALVELHSKHIIHRDIKSENVLIDLESKRIDGTPIVKLADFDRSVPLHSFMHTCCNAHLGIHAPDVCVGTPRWMAPEVVQAMHHRSQYGLEVDIWSYGCFLYELLTLQVPYYGQSETEIYGLLQMKRRPRLTPDLEALTLFDDNEQTKVLPDDTNKTKLLTDLFYDCTSSEPVDRPTAQNIYDRLCEGAGQNFVVS